MNELKNILEEVGEFLEKNQTSFQATGNLPRIGMTHLFPPENCTLQNHIRHSLCASCCSALQVFFDSAQLLPCFLAEPHHMDELKTILAELGEFLQTSEKDRQAAERRSVE